MLDGVDGSRAHAAAGRHSCDQQRVDSQRGQRRGERGSEERARILLREYGFAALRANAWREIRERRARAALEDFQRRHLAEEHATVATAILIGEIRMQDWDACAAAETEQLLAAATSVFSRRASVERRVGTACTP